MIKEYILSLFGYKYWIKNIRDKSVNEYNEKLCYCGHTYKCTCANPDKKLFRESVKRKTITFFSKNNGWKNFLLY